MKPILMVCAAAVDAASASAMTVKVLTTLMVPLLRSSDFRTKNRDRPHFSRLDHEPGAPQRLRQRNRVSLDLQARASAARQEGFRVFAPECIAGDRRLR